MLRRLNPVLQQREIIGIAIRMIPPEVMVDCRARADVVVRRSSRAAAAVIITIWVLFALFILYLTARATGLIST